MLPVHIKTTFVMKMTRICFVLITNEKFLRLLYSGKTRAHVYLPVPNIMLVHSYS